MVLPPVDNIFQDYISNVAHPLISYQLSLPPRTHLNGSSTEAETNRRRGSNRSYTVKDSREATPLITRTDPVFHLVHHELRPTLSYCIYHPSCEMTLLYAICKTNPPPPPVLPACLPTPSTSAYVTMTSVWGSENWGGVRGGGVSSALVMENEKLNSCFYLDQAAKCCRMVGFTYTEHVLCDVVV